MTLGDVPHSLSLPIFITKYNISFDNVFGDEECRNHFLCFLTYHNADKPLRFLITVNELLDADEADAQIMNYLSLVEMYIKPGGELELAMCAKNRGEIITWSESPHESDPRSLFEFARNNAYAELREEDFPRYVRSLQFKEFASSKGEDFMRKIGTNVTKTTGPKRFQPTDFLSDTIVDKDLQWCFKVCEDGPDWKLVSAVQNNDSCNHFDTFISRAAYTIGGLRSVRLVKFTGVVPYDINQVLPTWNDVECEKIFDEQLLNVSLIRYIKHNKTHMYSTSVIHSIMDYGPYLQTRDVVALSSLVYDAERDCYMRITKSTISAEQPISQDHVRAEVLIAFSMRALSENRTRYCKVMYIDPKTDVISEPTLYQQQIRTRGKSFHRLFLDAISKKEDDNFARPHDTIFTQETLEDFMLEHAGKTWDIAQVASRYSLKRNSLLRHLRKSSIDPTKNLVMGIVEYAHICEVKEVQMTSRAEKQLRYLLEAFRHPITGLSIANRKYRLKTYNNVFIASDCITWLGQYFQCTRPVAMRVATFLQRQGIIDHCLHQHIIKDSYLFFKFNELPHSDGLDWSPKTRKHVFKQKSKYGSPMTKEHSFESPIKQEKKSLISKNRDEYDRMFTDQVYGIVTITIEKAENLSSIDYSKLYPEGEAYSALRPYCIIEVAGESQTTTVKEGLCPKWHETFTFSVKKGLPVDCHVMILDADKDTHFGSMIGYSVIKIDGVGTVMSTSAKLQCNDKKRDSLLPCVQVTVRCGPASSPNK